MVKLLLILVTAFSFTVFSSVFPGDVNAKEESLKHLVFNFEKGQTKLSDEQNKKLKSFVSKAHENARVKSVEVAVWGDIERDTSASASEEEQELAKERGEYIKRSIDLALKSDKNVKVFNMAKTSNIGQRILRTKKAKLDPSYEMKAGDSPASKDVALLKADGGPSKAVAVFEFKKFGE